MYIYVCILQDVSTCTYMCVLQEGSESICGGRGECGCERCECSYPYTGDFCETIVSQSAVIIHEHGYEMLGIVLKSICVQMTP